MSPPARVTLSRAQGSKLTTMNLRVMPVALVENKTQRGGPPRGASGSDKKTAASWLRFEIYGYILSTYRPGPATLRARVCLTLYESHPTIAEGRRERSIAFTKDYLSVMAVRCLMCPVCGRIRGVFSLPITFYGHRYVAARSSSKEKGVGSLARAGDAHRHG